MHLRWCGALWATLLLSRPAGAVPYEVFIDIENEDDLYDLLATDQISEGSFDALLLLFQTRVDLRVATREELYLLPNLEYADVDRILDARQALGGVDGLDDLVSANALSARLARSLRAFVIISPRVDASRDVSGFVRLEARWTGRYDRLPPPSAAQARVRAGSRLDAGALLIVTRNDLRRVRWDALRDGFSVEPESARLVAPKAYVQWNAVKWRLVVGTYRIGFGQRLTFDATNQVTPNGAFGDYELRRGNDLTLRCKRSAGELERTPCSDFPVARVTPDFAWTNRLTGIAVGADRLVVGRGWLQVHGWGSLQTHRVQSRDIVDSGRCSNPGLDDVPACDAPQVYVRGGAPGQQSVARYATLPRVAVEPLGGLSLGYFWHARASLMLTGYGAGTRWLVRGASLDYQEIARRPYGGAFGALGLAAAYGARRHDLFVEVTRSLDRQTSKRGGTAFIIRSVTNVRNGELEVSLRGYGPRFANPYARPVSAPDELDGLRARDEMGVRARVVQSPHARVSLRALVDAWRRVSTPSLNALAFMRVDVDLADSWRLGTWVEHRTAGARTLLAARVAFEARRDLHFALQAQHRWHAAPPARGQRDVAAIFSLTARPVGALRLRLRVRYDVEDVFDNHRLPHTVWVYVESMLRVRDRDTFGLRYDVRAYVDERESTGAREPNPEHWLAVQYVVQY